MRPPLSERTGVRLSRHGDEKRDAVRLYSTLKRYRVALSGLFALLLVYLSRPTPVSFLIGLPLAILGECIRTWSSGHIRKNKALAMTGPYAYTRNPLYFGNFLIGAGFVSIGNHPAVGLIFLVSFGAVYWSVIRSEEESLLRSFGSEFSDYTRRVPRFFPTLVSKGYLPGRFDWSLVWRHREYQAWIGILAGIGALAFRMFAFE